VPPPTDVDYWQVLGLEPGADAASLKRAFRQQARRWHPDLNGNDPVAEERFKLVNEAYAVLSDPRRRTAWESGEDHQGTGGRQDPFASGFPVFEEYLEELFGAATDAPRWEEPSPGPEPDREPVPQEEPDHGDEPEPEPPPFRRRGAVTAAAPPPPPVRAAADVETVVDLSPEQALGGSLVQLELADGTLVEVPIPPQAGDGWRLRLAGVTPGGGDHFLHLRVRTPEGLRIDGLRVHYLLELSPADAALGCQVPVPTLDGPVRLRIPAGSSSGRLLRLRRRGLASGDERGDQLVEVRIVVPEVPSEAEEALYRRLREIEEERLAEEHG
jgi:DnaJ-class molecular chaperone